MDTKRLTFTNSRLSKLPIPEGRAAWHYDVDTPGFAFTVSPQGKRCFYFVGRVRGIPRRIKIGEFPSLSAADARGAVRGIVGDVALGREVNERKRQGRATVDDLFAHYLAVHAKPKKQTWKRNERDYARLLKPTFGKCAPKDVKRDEVKRYIAEAVEAHGRGAANRAHSLLSSMYTVGIEDGWCEVNPVRGITRPTFDPRQRYLKAGEVTAFLAAVEGLRSKTARDYLKLCLYTGARRSNVGSMRWDEIDLSLGMWVIPAAKAKSKKPYPVPLSTHAVEVIEARHGNGSEWVLPAPRGNGHYADPKHAWEQVRMVSGLDDLRIHDLRRSMGAWQQRGGASLRTIQQTLGHSNPAITARVYSPVDHEQVRAASQAAIDALMGAGR